VDVRFSTLFLKLACAVFEEYKVVADSYLLDLNFRISSIPPITAAKTGITHKKLNPPTVSGKDLRIVEVGVDV
jgi:hypothetical protein